VLVTRLARDPRVSRRRKLLLFVLVGYLALPFDLVPDFIPVAGQLDDAIIVALVLRSFVRSSGNDLVRELWPGPEQSLVLILRLARSVEGLGMTPLASSPRRARTRGEGVRTLLRRFRGGSVISRMPGALQRTMIATRCVKSDNTSRVACRVHGGRRESSPGVPAVASADRDRDRRPDRRRDAAVHPPAEDARDQPTQHVALTDEQQAHLGSNEYAKTLRANRSRIVSSGPRYDEVQRVAKRIGAVASRDKPQFVWKVTLLRKNVANAYCLPGGKIVVYTGILPVTQNDAGLATVLGHEVAHATAEHVAERGQVFRWRSRG
jgi:uncharacterized membrane protein YkvA (DUF1232 family)